MSSGSMTFLTITLKIRKIYKTFLWELTVVFWLTFLLEVFSHPCFLWIYFIKVARLLLIISNINGVMMKSDFILISYVTNTFLGTQYWRTVIFHSVSLYCQARVHCICITVQKFSENRSFFPTRSSGQLIDNRSSVSMFPLFGGLP